MASKESLNIKPDLSYYLNSLLLKQLGLEGILKMKPLTEPANTFIQVEEDITKDMPAVTPDPISSDESWKHPKGSPTSRRVEFKKAYLKGLAQGTIYKK